MRQRRSWQQSSSLLLLALVLSACISHTTAIGKSFPRRGMAAHENVKSNIFQTNRAAVGEFLPKHAVMLSLLLDSCVMTAILNVQCAGILSCIQVNRACVYDSICHVCNEQGMCALTTACSSLLLAITRSLFHLIMMQADTSLIPLMSPLGCCSLQSLLCFVMSRHQVQLACCNHQEQHSDIMYGDAVKQQKTCQTPRFVDWAIWEHGCVMEKNVCFDQVCERYCCLTDVLCICCGLSLYSLYIPL